MTRFVRWMSALIALAGLSGAPAFAQNVTTTVAAPAGSLTMGGAPITAGTVVFVPVNSSGGAVAITQYGGGLNLPGSQTNPVGYPCAITNGGLSGCAVPDQATATAATPSGKFGWDVIFTDTSTADKANGQSFELTQVTGVTGTSWRLDQWTPTVTTPVTQAYTYTIGPGTAPSSCSGPSVDVRVNSGQATASYCFNGRFMPLAGGSGTLSATGIVAGAYGASNMVPVCTYNALGQATSCSNQQINYNGLVNLPTIPAKLSQLTNDAGYVTAATAPVTSVNGQTGAVNIANTGASASPATSTSLGTVQLASGQTSTTLAKVATSGSYNDLANQPTIPSNTNQLTNGAGFVTAATAPVTSVNGQTGAVTITGGSATNAAGSVTNQIQTRSSTGSFAATPVTADASGNVGNVATLGQVVVTNNTGRADARTLTEIVGAPASSTPCMPGSNSCTTTGSDTQTLVLGAEGQNVPGSGSYDFTAMGDGMFESYCSGWAGDDQLNAEGVCGHQFFDEEPATNATFNVSENGANLTTIHQPNNKVGQGRYIVSTTPDWTGTVTSGQWASNEPFAQANLTGRTDTAGSMIEFGAAVSAGTNVVIPVAANPTSGHTTASTAAFVVGNPVCISEAGGTHRYFEIRKITSVSSSTITVNMLRYNHSVTALAGTGGLCGYAVEQTASTAATGALQVWPIVTSVDNAGTFEYSQGLDGPMIATTGGTPWTASNNGAKLYKLAIVDSYDPTQAAYGISTSLITWSSSQQYVSPHGLDPSIYGHRIYTNGTTPGRGNNIALGVYANGYQASHPTDRALDVGAGGSLIPGSQPLAVIGCHGGASFCFDFDGGLGLGFWEDSGTLASATPTTKTLLGFASGGQLQYTSSSAGTVWTLLGNTFYVPADTRTSWTALGGNGPCWQYTTTSTYSPDLCLHQLQASVNGLTALSLDTTTPGSHGAIYTASQFQADADPTTDLETATKHYVDTHGSAPAGSTQGRVVYQQSTWSSLSDFSIDTANVTASISNGKVLLSGNAGSEAGYLLVNSTTAADENVDYEVLLIAGTASGSGAGFSLGKRSINPTVNANPVAACWVNLTASTAQLQILDGPATANPNPVGSSVAIGTVAVGDLQRQIYSQRGNVITCIYDDFTQGIHVTNSIQTLPSSSPSAPAAPNSSQASFWTHGGTYTLQSIKAISRTPYGPNVAFLGDSKQFGYGAQLLSQRPSSLLESLGPVATFAGEGDTTTQLLADMPAVIADKPKYLVVEGFYNDVAQGLSTATSEANYSAIVNQAQAAGITVIHELDPPSNTNVDTSSLRAWVKATYASGDIVDTFVGWNTSTDLASDNIHPNAAGYALIAQDLLSSGFISKGTGPQAAPALASLVQYPSSTPAATVPTLAGRVVTSNFTALPTDQLIYAECSSACTGTLPSFSASQAITVVNIPTFAVVTLASYNNTFGGQTQTIPLTAGATATVAYYPAGQTWNIISTGSYTAPTASASSTAQAYSTCSTASCSPSSSTSVLFVTSGGSTTVTLPATTLSATQTTCVTYEAFPNGTTLTISPPSGWGLYGTGGGGPAATWSVAAGHASTFCSYFPSGSTGNWILTGNN